jgi:hypothetical protein
LYDTGFFLKLFQCVLVSVLFFGDGRELAMFLEDVQNRGEDVTEKRTGA